jgi:hypothetical protein
MRWLWLYTKRAEESLLRSSWRVHMCPSNYSPAFVRACVVPSSSHHDDEHVLASIILIDYSRHLFPCNLFHRQIMLSTSSRISNQSSVDSCSEPAAMTLAMALCTKSATTSSASSSSAVFHRNSTV